MTNKKVLIADSFSKEGIELLQNTPGIEVIDKGGYDRDTLLTLLDDVQGMIIRSATTADKEVLDKAKDLKVVIRAGVGVDNIDIPHASKKGIIVMNAPGGNSVSTAEQAIALMFAAARRTPQASAAMHQGKWEKKQNKGVQLTGKTIGVLGLGRIGREVVKRAKGLQMEVIGYDPYIPADKLSHLEIELKTVDEILALSDFITIHTPLTDTTKDLLNAKSIQKLKKSAIVINCARGGIYNEKDLADALKEGRIKAAAMDVFTSEPIAKDNPLIGLDNAILTPHLGASTDEAQTAVALEAAQTMVDFLNDGVARNSLNFPTLEPKEMSFLEPYFKLGDILGQLGAGMLSAPIENIQIRYIGGISSYNTKPVTTAILKGLLSVYHGDEVNIVNAPYMAEEKSLVPIEEKIEKGVNYQNLIRIRFSGGKDVVTLEGIIYSGKPRIVKVDDFTVDFEPKGSFLLVRNKDVLGVVGYIGTYLANKQINISNLELSRGKEGEALTLISLDSTIAKENVDELKTADIILDAKSISIN